MEHDPFDEILGLEEQFYDEGYQQGLTDGVDAGRIEGRTFGLEKGLEKYVESGRLYGKSLIWANRIPQFQSKSKSGDSADQVGAVESTSKSQNEQTSLSLKLPQLPDNPRLAKHVKVLHALAESETLPTDNTEDAVSDFDDRLKRAQAKAKVIERMAGEVKVNADGQRKILSSNDGSIEDVSILKARH